MTRSVTGSEGVFFVAGGGDMGLRRLVSIVSIMCIVNINIASALIKN